MNKEIKCAIGLLASWAVVATSVISYTSGYSKFLGLLFGFIGYTAQLYFKEELGLSAENKPHENHPTPYYSGVSYIPDHRKELFISDNDLYPGDSIEHGTDNSLTDINSMPSIEIHPITGAPCNPGSYIDWYGNTGFEANDSLEMHHSCTSTGNDDIFESSSSFDASISIDSSDSFCSTDFCGSSDW